MKKSKGVYINEGSEKFLGETWMFTKRTPFAGEVVDYSNKRDIILRESLKYKEKNPDASAAECYTWGKRYVNKEQKHFRSYLKGKNSYFYKGSKYLVEDLERKEAFERIGKALEEKFKEQQDQDQVKEIEDIDVIIE